MNKTDKKIMISNNNNEGIVNNSNEPSQTNKLKEMIEQKISDLQQQQIKIVNEIQELKTIEVTDNVKKIVVGSTQFNIENFMSEPDIQKYRNWLKVKEELEKESSESDIQKIYEDELDEKWRYEWTNYVHDHQDTSDYDPWDYIDFHEFIENYLDSDSYELRSIKEDFESQFSKDEILEEYIKDNL